MKTDKQKIGDLGEDLAADYLQEKGYTIIERNFTHNQYELDMICLDKNELVVVEVKSIRSKRYGSAEGRLSRKKQSSIITCSYAYLDRRSRFAGMDMRFDLVCVDLTQYPAQINHYKAAFWESW